MTKVTTVLFSLLVQLVRQYTDTIKDSLFSLLAPRPIHNNQDSY